MTAIDDMIARVEKATGPDRGLDVEIEELLFSGIHFTLLRPNPYNWMTQSGGEWRSIGPDGPIDSSDRYVSDYTASIDAALSLVEKVLPGCAYRLQRNLNGADYWRELHWFSSGAYCFAHVIDGGNCPTPRHSSRPSQSREGKGD